MRNRIEYAGKVFSDGAAAAYRLTRGNCLLTLAPMSDSLAADTLEFDVKSADTGLVDYSLNEQMAYYYRGERIGTFYTQSVKRTGADTYHFAATSAVGLLMGKTHYGGMYTGQTVQEAVADICSGTGVTITVKTIFQAYKLYGWLPVATARDNLSQVVFAIGAALKTDAGGALRVTSLFSEPSWSRGADKCFLNGSVDYGTPVSRVIVTEHKWESGGEGVTLFDGAAGQGDVIRFDEPVYGLQANGFTILESNCNYAKVSTGTGTLSGTKYVHNMRDIIRQVSEGEGNDVTVKEAWLVSLMNSVGVAERLAGYYRSAEKIGQEALWAGEHSGDVVRTAHPYAGRTDAMLTSVDINMSGTLRASEEGVVGYRPQPPNAQTYYDHVEVLTGSGEWTVPDDVTSVTAVLIGGGKGGAGGAPGGVGQRGGSSSQYDSLWKWTYKYGHAGSAGEGGEPASGSEGGKILEVNFAVESGQKIAYRCGAGGAGGTSGADGALGTDTTFGDKSSDTGSVRPGGYIDPMTKNTYARAGMPGIKGGKGTGSSDPGSASAQVAVGDTVVGPDGTEYVPGATYKGGTGFSSAFGGGYGGGAAVGNNGGDGRSGGYSYSTSQTDKEWWSANGGQGGSGATPIAQSEQLELGGGGHGGHGGGGGGGGGYASAHTMPKEYPNGTASAGPGAPGPGGSGGQGGQGGPGGILLYYSVPKKTRSGRFLAAGKAPFFAGGRRTFAV